MSALRDAAIKKIHELGYSRRDEPFRLSSGEMSRDYIDGKRAIANGASLRLVAEAVLEIVEQAGVTFDAVGGLTMGADPLAHAVALLSERDWFSVRKEAKVHGKQKLIEGTELQASARVLLVDDVVTTGASIVKAMDAVRDIGAQVVLAVTLVDRGDVATKYMEEQGVLYRPLASYRDLGIEPVGYGSVAASSPGG